MPLSMKRALAIVFALPIIVRAPLLLGFFLADPFYRFAGVSVVKPGPFPGMPTIDPNVGFVDQALTTRALDSLLSGTMPWWNPFEGFGAPLAGEMQDSALFPLSFIINLPNGPLFLSIVLSVLAGIGMLLLLRRLGIDAFPATVGAILFEMCGTFSWLSGAWTYSIPWLPSLILGIEFCRSERAIEVRRGIVIVTVSTALLIYSGFIETSYFEGLVGVAWTIGRFFSSKTAANRTFVLPAALGAVLGIALGLPILVAFVDALSISFVGQHDAKAGTPVLVSSALLQKFVPYAFGPIFASRQDDIGVAWGNTGGYFGFTAILLALAGMFGRKNLGLRVVLALVVIFGFTAMFGGPLFRIFLAIPGVKYTAYYRYVDPSIEFAVAVLAAFSIDDFITRPRRWKIAIAFTSFLVVVIFVGSNFVPELIGALGSVDADLTGWRFFSAGMLIVSGAAIVAALLVKDRIAGATILGALGCAEAIVFLVVPIFSYPTAATVALGGVRYLRHEIGLQRFYTLGPIGPNYGSFFGIADLDYADNPTPGQTIVYVKKHLDDQTDGYNFLGSMPRLGSTHAENFANNLKAFEDVGVKYLLTPPDAVRPSPQLIPRYRDDSMTIFEVPNPKPYFTAPGCRLDILSRTSLTASCAKPASLCRLELNVPGWVADLNGANEVPAKCGEIFQEVQLPAGKSVIAYSFEPPHMRAAAVVFAIAILLLIVILFTSLKLRPAASTA